MRPFPVTLKSFFFDVLQMLELVQAFQQVYQTTARALGGHDDDDFVILLMHKRRYISIVVDDFFGILFEISPFKVKK